MHHFRPITSLASILTMALLFRATLKRNRQKRKPSPPRGFQKSVSRNGANGRGRR